MSQQNSTILLVTDWTPQSQLFTDYVAQQLGCEVAAVHPHDVFENGGFRNTLALLDVDHADEHSMQQWHGYTVDHPSLTLAAFNFKNEDHAANVLASLHLQGVFYRQDSLELICKGILALTAGDLWMSRSLMARLVHFYRSQQLNAFHPTCGLTHRELEIIGLLGLGASNPEIAAKLFVSEHTVKSHLYNTFSKIKVRNRVQAMNWARQHLGVPPPSHHKTQTAG